ncbi:MAG TPA: single-stranded DNA-binding protein [Solirubrobacteraceae bacterium]|jgi:single-strand DNA-binding protein
MSYSNINRVVIVGRLTKDPELRALPSGSTVCGLRLASNTLRKSADGEHMEKPNFFDVSVFGAPGETVHRYMSRGRRVAIDGHLEWSEWDTPEGVKRQAVEIVADRVQFLDGRGPQGGAEGSSEGTGSNDDARSGEDEHSDAAVEGGERELVGVGAHGIDDDLVF